MRHDKEAICRPHHPLTREPKTPPKIIIGALWLGETKSQGLLNSEIQSINQSTLSKIEFLLENEDFSRVILQGSPNREKSHLNGRP